MSVSTRAHLRYLRRDGTTRAGEPGRLYGRDEVAIDPGDFQARGAGDRHQFRLIVSPEDGADYEDLKPLTRRLMAQVEEDLGTRLDWVAVDHHNTGHPHTHIVVRGKDERGADLVIAREYLTTGIRARACELVELDLGPRAQREIDTGLRREVEQERMTSLDRALLREQDADRIVAPGSSTGLDQALRAGRLAKLERLGLAERLPAGRWRLAAGLRETLVTMSERGDIVRLMQRQFSAAQVARAATDQAIYDPLSSTAQPLVGRVLARGLADVRHVVRGVAIQGIQDAADLLVTARSPHAVKIHDAGLMLDALLAASGAGRLIARVVDRRARHDRRLDRKVGLSEWPLAIAGAYCVWPRRARRDHGIKKKPLRLQPLVLSI